MKRLLPLAFVFGVVFLASCATQTYLVNGNGGNSPDKKERQTFFVSGIGQEQEMNAADICGGPEKVAKVQSKINFLDGLFGLITYGVYTPRTAMVYCSK